MIIIDRIEGDIAVCEVDGVMQDIPLSFIAKGAKEGDMLIQNEDSLLLIPDISATEMRKASIDERFERLKARKKRRE